ncbi:MAG: hypothetical protein GX225_08090 [Clostridiales bacterium]|nr:hypothetical protein [Clostridiales bacterium]
MMMANKKLKLNNKGATLVEVIVVVAIMIVVIGGMTIGFSLITNTYTRQTKDTLEDYIGSARTKAKTVTADEWNVEIAKESNGDYKFTLNKVVKEMKADGSITSTPEVVDEKLVSGDVIISFVNDTGYKVDIDDTSSNLKIVFEASKGSVSNIMVNDVSIATDGDMGSMGTFTVTKGSFSKKLELYFITGKCEEVFD